jgi:hypothetical protein
MVREHERPGRHGSLHSLGTSHRYVLDYRLAKGRLPFLIRPGGIVKVFLSWSGDLSRRIAEEFKQWLPQVIQDVQVFFSPDILRGKQWLQTLREELEENSFGIFCITPGSLSSLWMSYEAGAIVSRNKDAMAVPLLFGLSLENVKNTPYAPFQAVVYSREEIFNLIESINKSKIHPLESSVLKRAFDKNWPDLDEKISELLPPVPLIQTPIKPVYEQADQGLFASVAHQLIGSASRVTLVGTGLCILTQDPIRQALFERARSQKCRVEIFLGNPNSPSLQNRLIEEETGEWSPSVGYSGLVKRAETLLREWRLCGSPQEISLYMFDHYPTMAIIIIDGHYFVYPYGYATLGNFSPVLYYSAEEETYAPMRRFLDHQVEMIRRNSTPMELVARTFPHAEQRIAIEKTVPAAVYFVPPPESELYQFGTRILGYDVHKGVVLSDEEGDYRDSEAHRCGFHMTLCDVLYFLKKADIQWIYEEVRFLAESIKSFPIRDLHLAKDFPDKGTISLCMTDPTGTLEALHHELVHRLYRRSIGSNFTFRTTNRAKGSFTQRDRLMIDRYHAPFILSAFRPHFTLMTDIQAEEMDSAYARLAAEMAKQQVPDEIEIGSLAVMEKAGDGIHFGIVQPLIRLH